MKMKKMLAILAALSVLGTTGLTVGAEDTATTTEPATEAITNVINLKRLLNGKQNVWKYQNGEEKSDSDGREKDV